MKEKIEQLCDQIKDLLKKNDREYIVANVPMSTEESGDYCLPEYYKTIIGDLSVDFLEKLNTVLDTSAIGDAICIDEEENYEDEDEPNVRCYSLIAIRIKNDELFFCIDQSVSESDDEYWETEDVFETCDLSLYFDDWVVDALEAYERILSDKAKYSIFWEI